MNEIESPTPSLRSRVVATPTFGGLCGGLLLWFQSLTPTLIPRPWIAQSVISGVCLAIGYGFGAAVGYWLGQLLDRSSHSPGHLARQRWWLALGVGWLIAVSVGATLWLRWQNDQRGLMAMAPLDWFAAVFMVPLSGVVGLLLVIVGRTIGGGIRALNRKIEHRVSNPLAAIAALLLVVVLGVAIGGGAVFRGLTALANSAYASQNDETSDGISAPTSPSVSGSDESLVPWETLGRTGRDFVATATTPSQLETFHGPDAELVDPVRVYVGVQSADSLQDRAELAVRELERAGGFEREVLVVWVPTGSGWMIPEAAAALEQLYRGDTAIVAIQYSFLPSILAVFMDPGLAIESGSILLSAVEERWSRLPAGDRPKLLMFGKSLGTSGVEAPFAAVDGPSSVANLVARTDGALIVGAKHDNPIHSQLTQGRDPGSPVWQPVVDAGRTVHFVTRDPNQPALESTWTSPRVVYLQHPSDPVTFWGVDALWRPPEWMDRPRGYDVSDASQWFPIVSGVQAVGDLIYQLSPPPGFGHDFSTDYVNGWAQVLAPQGWTDADTLRLEEFLDDGGAGESEQ